jgi:hypothetical protein
MSFVNMDPDTIDRLSSTAMERLLTPKVINVNPKKVPDFGKLCPFSPTVGAVKSPKTQERLKTP